MHFDNAVVVLGNSPFIQEIEDKIPKVLEQYTSIGINDIIDTFATNIHAFLDVVQIERTNKFPDMKTISLKQHDEYIKKESKELFDAFVFNANENVAIKNESLAYNGFTHDFVLSYCLYKGWKTVFLIGAADFITGSHYTHNKPFSYAEPTKKNSLSFISNFCTKHACIYTCNPESSLKVPYVSIENIIS